jgi:hypothetical protein
MLAEASHAHIPTIDTTDRINSSIKRQADNSIQASAKRIRVEENTFKEVCVLNSENPNRKALRVFSFGDEMFVLKADLLGVLVLKESRFQHLQRSIAVNATEFKSWAKKLQITVGVNTRVFIVVNKGLIDFLVKFDETYLISIAIKNLMDGNHGKEVS